MTRLNSTFRSGCKLSNRTIRGEKQAGQAQKLRSNSRALSKKNRVFIDVDKTLVRTCKVFRTALHERPERTTRTTSEKAIRVMDVARQSSMEEGLQVQLLSWKEKPDNLISGKLKERCGCDDDVVLSRVREDLQGSDGAESDGQVKACNKQDSEALGQLNGVERIEACVRSENRMRKDTNLVEKAVNDTAYVSHFEHSKPESSVIPNGIACNDMHLRSTLRNDLQGNLCCTRNESKDFDAKPSAHSNMEQPDACLRGVQWTVADRPNHSHLRSTKDKCITNVRENKTIVETSGETLVIDQYGDDRTIQKKDTGVLGNEINLLGDSSRRLPELNVDCIDFGVTSERQANIGAKSNITDEFKNDNIIEKQSCLCDGIDGATPSNSVSKMGGRPKRTSRQLRSRHEDDYILDVRQIPHKFNDRISTVKKGNRKALVQGCRKRRRTQKQDIGENIEVVANTSEKVTAANESTDDEKYLNVDCVLGVRHDGCNKHQVLVQFTDGTSNWIKKSEVRLPLTFLCDYFSHPDQDVMTAQRLPAQWFECQVPSWEDRPLKVTDFGDFDFYNRDSKRYRDGRASMGPVPNNQNYIPPQNLLSGTHELSEDSMSLAESYKFYFRTDAGIVSPDVSELIQPAELYSPEINEHSVLDRYSSNPLALNILTNGTACVLKDMDSTIIDDDFSESEKIDSKLVEGSPQVLQGIFDRDNLSVSADAVPIFISRNGELEVLQSDHIEIILRHKDKRSKRIRSETCDNLIHQLESRINDDTCQFVVINGLEDYFASSMDMDKLIKFPCEAEKTKYDEKMANLRYVLSLHSLNEYTYF